MQGTSRSRADGDRGERVGGVGRAKAFTSAIAQESRRHARGVRRHRSRSACGGDRARLDWTDVAADRAAAGLLGALDRGEDRLRPSAVGLDRCEPSGRPSRRRSTRDPEGATSSGTRSGDARTSLVRGPHRAPGALARRTPQGIIELTKRVRRALVGVFPYAVFFLVLGDRVRVFAILHQHRRPSTWSKRQRS